jgi:membrane dipeptidase
MERILDFEPFLNKWGFVTARTVSQIESAHGAGKIAVIYQCNASYMLGSPFDLRGAMISTFNVKRLDKLYELGVRVMQVTDDYKGYVGDGCTERTNCGLTDYGIWAVKTMNELGLVIDCSHAGYKTSMEVIERSQSPVIFSHANVNALCQNKCNLSDEQIRAVASKGGVIGISSLGAFVDPNQQTVQRFLDHVDYVSKLVGVEHVGLGMNYSHETDETFAYYRRDPAVYPKPPWTYAVKDPSAIPSIGDGLRARGYDEKTVAQILGENYLRVFRQVWKG